MFIVYEDKANDETAAQPVQPSRMGGKQRMSKKYLYYFSEGNDAFGGDKVTMKNILGGKHL